MSVMHYMRTSIVECLKSGNIFKKKLLLTFNTSKTYHAEEVIEWKLNKV